MRPQEPDVLRVARAGAYENSRPELRRHVSPGVSRILDLGCASGVVGETLKLDLSVEVVGIELDPVYAERAAARLDRVINADIEELVASPDDLDDLGSFDCVLAGDVLEHLRDPWRTLGYFVSALRPGGVAIVSLPNIRHWQTFWQLGARGRWPRHSEGIFDRDHLRWFTVADGTAMLERAGLRVQEVDYIYRLGTHISRWDSALARLERTPLREFLTFQFVLVGRREGPAGTP